MAITPITFYSDAEQSGVNTAFSVIGTTPALTAGVPYLIIWHGVHGSNTNSATPRSELNLRYDGDGINFTTGSVRSVVRLGDKNSGGQIQGFTVYTPTVGGVFQFRARMRDGNGTTETWYAGSLALIAIPLTDLAEGTDYFQTSDISGTVVLQNADDASWEVIKTVDFTIPTTEDYLCLFSCDGRPGSASSSIAARWRPEIDASEIMSLNPGADDEAAGPRIEANRAGTNHGFAWAQIVNLSAGMHTFRMMGRSRTNPTADFLSPNIILIRANSFTRLSQVQTTSQSSSSSTTYGNATGLSDSIDSADPVVILGAVTTMATEGDAAQIRLRNDTDATNHRDDSGSAPDDGGFDTASDLLCAVLPHSETPGGNKTYVTQLRSTSTNQVRLGTEGDGGAGANSNLIIWELVKVVTQVAPDPIVVQAALPPPDLLPQTLRPDPIVQQSVVVVPGQVPPSLTLSLITSSVGGAGPNKVEALLEDRGHVVTQRAANTVTAGDLSADTAVVVMLVSTGDVANVVSALTTAAVPVVVGFSTQAVLYANTRTTPNVEHQLGLVANTETVSLGIVGDVALVAGSQDLAPTRGYPLGFSPRLYAVAESINRGPSTATQVGGRALLVDTAGRPLMAAADVGESRLINIGGTFAVRSAWAGWINGTTQDFRRDGGAIMGSAVEWAAGLFENLPFPTL